MKQRLEVAETSLKSIQERSVEIESEAKDIQSKLTIQINGLQTELHMFQVSLKYLYTLHNIYFLMFLKLFFLNRMKLDLFVMKRKLSKIQLILLINQTNEI